MDHVTVAGPDRCPVGHADWSPVPAQGAVVAGSLVARTATLSRGLLVVVVFAALQVSAGWRTPAGAAPGVAREGGGV